MKEAEGWEKLLANLFDCHLIRLLRTVPCQITSGSFFAPEARPSSFPPHDTKSGNKIKKKFWISRDFPNSRP